MIRREWEDLPDTVRAAVESETGPIAKATRPSNGRNADMATVLHVATGRIFCKGIAADNSKAWMHRVERRVNSILPHHVAPRLLWGIEMTGWLLLGFEFVSGRHADLSPGSSHLPLVATAVSAVGSELTPCPVALRRLSEQWQRISAWRRIAADIPDDLDQWERQNLDRLARWESLAIELMDGDSLIHGDLHSLNLLVSDHVKIIDWAWSCRGAAWVDPAFLVIRLIGAGHAPRRAEEWAERVPLWAEASDTARTAFSVAVLGMWEYRGRQDPAPRWARLTAAARTWARHRLGD